MATTNSREQELKFEIGKTYLIKIYGSLQEVYVDKITKTAYKLKKERSDGTWYIEWVGKSEFKRLYEILEYLYTPNTPPQLETEKIMVEVNKDLSEECPVCGGSGKIPDDRITSGESSCPKCLGSGRVWRI